MLQCIINQSKQYVLSPLIRYLYDQCLIGGASWYEALWSVVGSLVLKNGSSDGVSAWPVHCPVSIQIIASLGVPDSQVGAGRIQFHHADTPSSCWDGYHPIVLWERVQNFKQAPSCKLQKIPTTYVRQNKFLIIWTMTWSHTHFVAVYEL